MSFTTSTHLAIFFDGKGINYYADMQDSTDFVHRFFSTPHPPSDATSSSTWGARPERTGRA